MRETDLFRLFKESSTLILDGALGSLLQQKGYKPDKNLWTSYLNFNNPKAIQYIHEEYIDSGCDIITTNTFRTNPVALKKFDINIDVNSSIKRSVNISKAISDKYNILLAGSNAPAEDCYQKERTLTKDKLISNHHHHIDLLFESGVDFILNETQSHFDEIEIICEYCSNNNIPFVISLFADNNLNILSGQSLTEIISFVQSFNPLAICINCITRKTFEKILRNLQFPSYWGFYLNCGSGNFEDENIQCGIDENQYSEIVKTSLNLVPKIIGACCGSNPKHIKSIKNLIYGKTNT